MLGSPCLPAGATLVIMMAKEESHTTEIGRGIMSTIAKGGIAKGKGIESEIIENGIE